MKLKDFLVKLTAFVLALTLFMGDGAGLEVFALSNFQYETKSEYDDPFISSKQWYHSVLETPRIWHSKSTGAGVKVAVLSTGYTAHDDMEILVRDNLTVGAAADISGEGTAMCALIGATANNDLCGCGIAPEAKVISMKVSQYGYGDDALGGDEVILANAIRKAVKEYDVDIICIGNMKYEDNGDVKQAVMEAYKAGVAVFVAAGDDNASSVTYPCAYEGAIPVAGLNETLTKSGTSNYGRHIRYAAPGVGYVVLNEENAYSVCRDEERNSSSYAAAIVAGQAALLWNQAEGEGSKKVDNLLKIMDRSCIGIKGGGMGRGMVNLPKAFGMPDSAAAPAKPEFLVEGGTYPDLNLEIELAKPDYGVQLYYSLDGNPIKATKGILSDNAIAYNGKFLIDSVWDSVKNNGVVVVCAVAYNATNGTVSGNVRMTYKFVPPITKLVIEQKNFADDRKVMPGEKLELKANCTPSFGKKEKVNWKLIPKAVGYERDMVRISGQGVITVSKDAVPGMYVVEAVTENGLKNEGEFAFEVVKPENPAKFLTMEKKMYSVLVGDMIPLAGQITYKDGTKESFDYENMEWRVEDSSVVTIVMQGNQALFKALSPGKTTIYGSAADGSGKKVKITVFVKPEAEYIEITGTQRQIARGASAAYKANVFPGNAADKEIVWSVVPANKGVTVSDRGKVTVSKNATAGNYTITATLKADSSIYATKSVRVIPLSERTRKLMVSAKSVDIFRDNLGGNVTVYVECDTPYWEVAEVEPGIRVVKIAEDKLQISANKGFTGTRIVKLKTTDGSNRTASIRVNVMNHATGLMIAPAEGRSGRLATGCSLKMNAYYITETGKVNATGRKIKWAAYHSGVKVDRNGEVTSSLAEGESFTIYASLTDGSNVSASYTLFSDNKAKSLRLYGGADKVPVEDKRTLKAGAHYVYTIQADEQDVLEAVENIDIKVSEAGLVAYIEPESSNRFHVTADKKGTYTVRIRMKNGSPAGKTYTFVVK